MQQKSREQTGMELSEWNQLKYIEFSREYVTQHNIVTFF